MLLSCLYIKTSKNKGRGVFTTTNIEANTIIEISPVIVMSKAEQALLDQTLLHDYIFLWGKEEEQCCMAMGYVPVYNHSFTANCEYIMDYKNKNIAIQTVRAIKANEQLYINYNGDWNDEKPLWFEVK